MDIKPVDKTIQEILSSKCQFEIPRFQREYSWEKRNYREFFEDILSGLSIEKRRIRNNQYFLGTMLFVGNPFESGHRTVYVVDGQQRLITITIFFSCISDYFIKANETKLSDQLFKYIMTEDDNGEEVRLLKTATNYPFFAYYIQDKEKKHIQDPGNEEEQNIKEAYEHLFAQLEEDSVREQLIKTFPSQENDINKLGYVDILKAIRDQILQTTFVSISTGEKSQANMIFEILNAKGDLFGQVRRKQYRPQADTILILKTSAATYNIENRHKYVYINH